MYNKRATETRHCIHMLGYSMVQYTCTTGGPQRLDTASTCWATAWCNIHVQQEGHREETLHPHVGLQHGAIYMYNKRATETRHCIHMLATACHNIHDNKRATETRLCIHMLGYSIAKYTCTTRGPQRLDTASTCWAAAWYNIQVQQEGHRD